MTTSNTPKETREALAAWARASHAPTGQAPISERMQPLELLTVREALGLTREALADALDVSVASIRAWESGHRTIPDGVRRDMEGLETYTNDLAAALAAHFTEITGTGEPAIGAYTRDAELPELHLPGAPLIPTARWWRVVAYRAAEAVPGLRIVDTTTRTA